MKRCHAWCTLLICLALLMTIPSVLAEELQRGDKGEAVLELQQVLNDMGYDVGTPDGDFGKKTEKALKAWQKDHGLLDTGVLDEASSVTLYSEPILEEENSLKKDSAQRMLYAYDY